MNSRPEFEQVPARVWVIDPLAQRLHHTRFNVGGIADGNVVELRADQTLQEAVPLAGPRRGPPERYRFRILSRPDGSPSGDWAAFRIHEAVEPKREMPAWKKLIWDVVSIWLGIGVGIVFMGHQMDFWIDVGIGATAFAIIVRSEGYLDALRKRWSRKP